MGSVVIVRCCGAAVLTRTSLRPQGWRPRKTLAAER